MLGVLAAALGVRTMGEVCAAICVVVGAVKLVLETVETAQRVKKGATEED
jgi:hypothetical protein